MNEFDAIAADLSGSPPRAGTNNPGGMRPPGASTGFQSYATPEAGIAAIDGNLQAYGKKGIKTIADVVSRWAPPSENNTQAYISDVARRVGIPADQEIDLSNPMQRHALTTAIMLHEQGPKAIFGKTVAPSSAPVSLSSPATSAPASEYDSIVSDLSAPAQEPLVVEINGASNSKGYPRLPPGSQVDKIPTDGPLPTPTPDKDPSFLDRAIGAGEAGLSTVTGLTGGAVGQVAGAIKGIAHSVSDGSFGTRAGADQAEKTASEYANALTYQPRTVEGQRQAGIVGNAMGQLAPVMGLTGELGMLSASKGPMTAREQLQAQFERVKEGAPDVGARVEPSIGGAEPSIPGEAPTPVAGRQSVGSAAASYGARARAEGAPPDVVAAITDAERKGDLHATAAERHIEASSLPVPVPLTEGQATGNVNLLSHEQNSRGRFPELAQRFNDQNGLLIQNINAIRDEAAPDIYAANHVENGQALIDSYKVKDAALSADIGAKYKALEAANGGAFPVNGEAFVKAADEALTKKMKGRYVPPEVQADMDAIRNGGPMTYENFENMRTNLAAEARKAERSGDGNRAYAVSLVREALESLPMDGESAAIKPLADAARGAAKARFDLLREDPAYKAAVNDSTAADDFIHKFVINGKVENVKTMRANLADDPLAGQTIASGTINYLKTRAGINSENSGNFSQAGYNKAMSAIGPKLTDLVPPDHAHHLEVLGRVARYTQEQPRGSYVNNSNTLVGHMANLAKSTMERAGNAALPGAGLGSWMRESAQSRAASKAVTKSLKPGAGIRLSDIGK